MHKNRKVYGRVFIVVLSLLLFALMTLGVSAAAPETNTEGDVTINFYTSPPVDDNKDGGRNTGGNQKDKSSFGTITEFESQAIAGEIVSITDINGKHPSGQLPKTGSNYLLVTALLLMSFISLAAYIVTNKTSGQTRKEGNVYDSY